MRRLILPLIAVFFLLFPANNLTAQDAGPAHAPDFRAQQKLAPLYFPPKAQRAFYGHCKNGLGSNSARRAPPSPGKMNASSLAIWTVAFFRSGAPLSRCPTTENNNRPHT